jgi:hypothetical protein
MHDELELFQTGQVFGFPVDVKLVMSHLQQDMRDDWYADTLRYTDIFSDQSYTAQVLLRCLNEWGGLYVGDKRVLRSIPKKVYAERYSLETDFFDRFVYQAVCTFLIPKLDPLLSHRVLSYRYNRDASDAKYLFRSKIGKWLDYEGLTYRFRREGAYLAVTDVGNFFENVSSKHLITEIRSLAQQSDCDGYEKGQIMAAARVLEGLLENWSFSGEFGLPQNRDCSSFLSNILLSSFDFEMRKKGYDYYRYVDDIRIVCSSESEARRAIQTSIGLLREVGMNINASKTTILSPTSSDAEVQNLFPSQNPLVIAIDNMWRSKSRRVFIRSIEYIIQIIQDALTAGETQSRSFRFAVNRLSQLIDAGLFDIAGNEADQLLTYAINALGSDAVSTDQLCRLLTVLHPSEAVLTEIQDFLLRRSVCIHDWQNHHLWILLASRKFVSEALRELAARIVSLDPTSGEASGAFIWLQSIGELGPIDSLLENYSNLWPFQNQRYFLFAASGLPANRQKLLRGRIPLKLIGTMERAKKRYRADGVAIMERERPSFSALKAYPLCSGST